VADVVFDQVDKRYRVYTARYRSLKEVVFHRRFGEWEDHWALRGVSFEVEPGEVFGIIGPNGAGKSTSLKLIARILEADAGRVMVRRKVAGLLELGAGFVPEYTGRENIFLNASILGLSRRQIESRFDSIVDFAELGDAIDASLATYSSGMYMRLGFATAIHVDAEVLLVDEILAVGDEAFQRKCFDWLSGFQARGGTIVLVSHDLATVRDFCSRVAWIHEGQVQEIGNPSTVVGLYLDRVKATEPHGEEAREHSRLLASERAVELSEVRLLGPSGRPTASVGMGESLAVEIDYKVSQPLATPVFSVALYGPNGACVYATTSAIDGVEFGPLEEDGGVRLEYSDMQLLPGVYRVAVSLLSRPRGDAVVDSRPAAASFEVTAQTKEAGLVRLRHSWRTKKERRSIPAQTA